MAEERDPRRELDDEVAKSARLMGELAQSVVRMQELAAEVAALAPSAPPAKAAPDPEKFVPPRRQELYEGSQDARVRAFARVVSELTQPFSRSQAEWFARLSFRTTQRFIERAVAMGLLERVSRGRYQVT